MRNLKTFALGAVAASVLSFQATAASISFGGQAATDGSGLTSTLISADNIIDDEVGLFVETFDAATAIPDFPPVPAAGQDFNDDDAPGTCQINSLGASGISITASDPEAFGVRVGSVENVAATPANDTTCFGYTPAGGDTSVLPSWVEIDYSSFLASQLDTGITYLGFYWGSVDDYNDFVFYSGDDEVLTITGEDLLDELDGVSGDQTDPSSNVYVNINFSFFEQFDRFRITSSDIAGEFDNIVIGLSQRPETPVPAPAGLAILALGLLGVAARSRMSK